MYFYSKNNMVVHFTISVFFLMKTTTPGPAAYTHCPNTITKPPLFRRNGLTGSGNPTFESCLEVKAQQRQIEVYSRSSFQIPHDCTFL